MADGFLAPLGQLETSFWSILVYPLRSAESLAFVAITACAFWALTILLPEYCLSLWADANTLGTPSVGLLVILISAIPGLLVLPLVLIYFLQYLGRVLVSSAQGDRLPPRTPDRNFEGLTAGLSPWFIWLVLGVSVSCLPVGLYGVFAQATLREAMFPAAGLIVLGLPYAAVSLMMCFLHDRPLAATPQGVLACLCRHGISFLPTFLMAVVPIGVTIVAAILTLALRSSIPWGYLVVALAWWGLVTWTALVSIRVLGLHYYRHSDGLRWNRQQPRWGIRWRL
jgi:hypothetical protein